MCFGPQQQDQGGEPQIIYVPMDYMQQFQQAQQAPQGPQYLPYSQLEGMGPQGVPQGQGATDLLTSRPTGGDFSSGANVGTTGMLPGAEQMLRQQPSPQYTWA